MPIYPPEMAVRPLHHPMRAVVRPPGSKSITNRALVIAALARGLSRLEGALSADDTEAMREGLRALGAMIDDNDDPWLVLGTGGKLTNPLGPLDARGSGTTARFLTALAALIPGEVVIDGSVRMRQRPIEELVGVLRQMGAEVETTGGFLPVTVRGGSFSGGEVEVDCRRSSQFVSAVLMVAPMADAPVAIRPLEATLVSRPYVSTTIEVMRAFGASVVEDEARFTVLPTGYRATHLEIEADASAAVYPLVAAAITSGTVQVTGIPEGSGQADLKALQVLAEMGCKVNRRSDRIELIGPPPPLDPVDIDLSTAPDAAVALAVAAIFAGGASRLRNLGNLRYKESDRLAALQNELRRLGAGADIVGDDLIIHPGPLHAATIQTYDDHRMAMAFALAGLRIEGVIISDPGCVQKTWPQYFEALAEL